MFILNWLRKPKTTSVPDPDAPKIGDFRIVPYMLEFCVEEYGHGYYYNSKMNWYSPTSSRLIKAPTWIGTEEQCEKYIQWRMDKVRQQKEYDEKVASHTAANPPRRVPPFRYLK